MSLPMSTTTLKFMQVTSDPHMPETITELISGVPGHIDIAAGGGASGANERQSQSFLIFSEIVDVDINNTTHIIDERDNQRYEIDWIIKYETTGMFEFLNHIEAGASWVRGGVPA